MSALPVVFRESKPEDRAFIYSSWLRSYRDSEFARSLSTDIYFHGHRQVLERILDRATTIVACDPEDPDHIYGWLCHEMGYPPILHYVYVKHPYRGMGLGKQLFAAFDQGGKFDYTHQGRLSEKLKERGTFNPYSAVAI
jgi:GNAT superfamily N-acetyltransferase